MRRRDDGTPPAIRIAEARDLPAIVEIYNQAVAQRGATADLEPVTTAGRAAWFAEHEPSRHPIFVAVRDGQVAGWRSLSAYRPGRAALRHTAEISYYVHRSHRRMGIAARLVEHAINACPSLEIKTLFAIVLDVNQPSAALLAHAGFERWGHLPGVAEIDGVACGHLYYGRRVEAGR